MNLAAHRAEVEADAEESSLVDAIEAAGFKAAPWRAEASEEAPSLVPLVVAIGLTIPITVVSMAMMHRPIWVNWLIGLATVIVAAWPGRSFFLNAAKALRNRSSNMDTLVAVGAGAAIVYSFAALLRTSDHPDLYFETAAVIITLVLVGRTLEARAKHLMSGAISRLIGLAPDTVTLMEGETDRDVRAVDLKIGNLIRLRPGERIAADGEVVNGQSFVDESMITGESEPIEKSAGASVIAGTVNQNGTLVYRASKVGSETVLASIIRLVEQAQGSKAPIQRLADRISSIFVPIVLALALLVFVASWAFGVAVDIAFLRSIAVLVVSCPCALGLATPTAIIVGIGRGASLGILIKDAQTLEQAAHVRSVIFDKTGTLTLGRPVVTRFDLEAQASPPASAEVLLLAASAEKPSEHPIAKALVQYAKEQGLEPLDPEGFEAQTGMGVTARVGSQELRVQRGESGIDIFIDGEKAAEFEVEDALNETATEAIAALSGLAITPVLATGDTQAKAEAAAQAVGIERVLARVLPADKAQLVQTLRKVGPVAMVGDGINDAPALALADVGIAMGSGTGIAIETAPIVLLSHDLRGVTTAIRLSRATLTVIKWNLIWAFGYNIIMVPLAASGALSPMLASAAMGLSSITVVLNSLRLRRFT